MRTGSAAIHAAAVTAAAWIAALPVAMSGSCARARLARAQLPDIATGDHHGFPVGELAASSSPTGKPWVITPAAGRGRTAASSGGLEPVVTGSRPVG